MSDIFAGTSHANPETIAHELGQMEHDDHDQAIANLVGAVMTLCKTVAQLQREVSDLREYS